jgi:hypothetical protein
VTRTRVIGVHRDTLAFLEAHRAERVGPLTQLLASTIQAENPDYRDGLVVTRADLEDSCRSNITRVLELLAASLDVTVPEGDDQVYDAAKETGRRRAEQGIPLDAVLRSFRLGGRLIWEDLHHQVTAGAELDVDGLREAGTRLWVVVDATSAEVAAAYHAAERAMVRADDQRRAALWEDVMGGRAQDLAFAREAARILDVPVAGPMLVLALDGPDVLDTVELEHALAAAPVRATFVRRTDTVVGLVFMGEVVPAPIVDVVRKLTSCAVGVSSVIDGLPATDRGLAQATVALQTLAGRPGVVLFEECLPDALLLSAPDVTEHLVARWLGGLLALPAAEAEQLLATLEAWVASGGSAVATATAVHCHRNTVANRLRRVGDLTGLELGEVPPLDLGLALRALRLRPA